MLRRIYLRHLATHRRYATYYAICASVGFCALAVSLANGANVWAGANLLLLYFCADRLTLHACRAQQAAWLAAEAVRLVKEGRQP